MASFDSASSLISKNVKTQKNYGGA